MNTAQTSRKPRLRRNVTLKLPMEFIELCQQDGTAPETVLRGFIADLCELMNYVDDPRDDDYSSNGSDERSMAYDYYARVGYPWRNKLTP